MQRLLLLLCVPTILFIGCSSTGEDTSAEAITLRDEIEYWNATQPSLLEMRRIITPIATRLIDITPELEKLDRGAWKELAKEMAPMAVEVYRDVVKDLVVADNPLSSNLPEMRRLRADEMNAKISAMSGITTGWDTGDDDLMIDSYYAFFEAAGTLGREIDALRVDLGRRINEGCEEMRLRECSSIK